MAETVKREKDLAKDQQKSYQVSGLSAFNRLKKSNPEYYNQILQSHGVDPSMVDEKGQYKKPGPSQNMALGDANNVIHSGNFKTAAKVPHGKVLITPQGKKIMKTPDGWVDVPESMTAGLPEGE